MAPGMYKDLGKKAKDTLNNDFDYDLSAEVKGNASGVNLTTSVVRDGKSGAVKATLKNKWKACDWATLNTTLDTTGKISTDVDMNNFADGLKATATINLQDNSRKAGLEYVSDMFTATAQADLVSFAVTGTACVGVNDFAIGVSTVGGNLDKTDGAIQYNGDGYTASVNCAKRGNDIRFRYLHVFNKNAKAAAEFQYNRNDKKAHQLALCVDSTCTDKVSSKVKMSTNGIAELMTAYKLAPSTTVKLTLAANTSNLSAPGTKFGLAFNTEA